MKLKQEIALYAGIALVVALVCAALITAAVSSYGHLFEGVLTDPAALERTESAAEAADSAPPSAAAASSASAGDSSSPLPAPSAPPRGLSFTVATGEFFEKVFVRLVFYAPAVQIAGGDHFITDLDSVSGDPLVLSCSPGDFDAGGMVGGERNRIIITLIDAEGEYYNAYARGIAVERGQDYTLTAYKTRDLSEEGLTHLPHTVTLGGTVFATHNAGGYSPEDTGAYYSWGEAAGSEGGGAAADFAAQVGGSWRVPSREQLSALGSLAATAAGSWVRGYTFADSEGNSMFLAAAGARYGAGNARANYNCELDYWSADDCAGGDDSEEGYAYALTVGGAGSGVGGGFALYDWEKTEAFAVRLVAGE